MWFHVLWVALIVVGLVGCLHMLGVYRRYLPILARIFEEQPFFVTEEEAPATDAEEVSFATSDGLTLRGSYWRSAASQRQGVILFCHEFLARRWSASKYCSWLREAGFDIFTFDFRNHGQSAALPGYEPLQWVTDYEVADVEAALAYLKQRGDLGEKGVGLFGVSRGGAAGICAAARGTAVAALVTDGAFPTSGTQVFYIYRWARIYTKIHRIFARFPRAYVRMMAWLTCVHVGRKRGCRFANVERSVARLRHRPMLMIHGERDNYIDPEIIRELLRLTRSRAELWVVAEAKHNRGIDVAAQEYQRRTLEFFLRHLGRGRAPREERLTAVASE